MLTRIAERILKDEESLAVLESRDTGKPLRQARNDVLVAFRYFAFYAVDCHAKEVWQSTGWKSSEVIGNRGDQKL